MNLILLLMMLCSTNGRKVKVKIARTGDYTSSRKNKLLYAEPYKVTVLKLQMNKRKFPQGARWTIKFKPRLDEIYPDSEKKLVKEEMKGKSFSNVKGSKLKYTFKLPGKYEVKIHRISAKVGSLKKK